MVACRVLSYDTPKLGRKGDVASNTAMCACKRQDTVVAANKLRMHMWNPMQLGLGHTL
jgi:hypothetical protein